MTNSTGHMRALPYSIIPNKIAGISPISKKEAEDALVAAALRHADGNQGVAAGLLGVSRQALNKRLRRRQPLRLPHV